MKKLTLHEAMVSILKEQPDKSMNYKDLAEEINRRNLYHKEDLSELDGRQIIKRAINKNYSDLSDVTISLR